jgi:hypothetical protein
MTEMWEEIVSFYCNIISKHSNVISIECKFNYDTCKVRYMSEIRY